jgi:hypothetical protein
MSSTGRLGSHAAAAVFVILLAAFGVFCSYYPWKIPATSPASAKTSTATIEGAKGGKPMRVSQTVGPADYKGAVLISDHDGSGTSSGKSMRIQSRVPATVSSTTAN